MILFNVVLLHRCRLTVRPPSVEPDHSSDADAELQIGRQARPVQRRRCPPHLQLSDVPVHARGDRGCVGIPLCLPHHHPPLLASSALFLAKSCADKEFRTWMLGPKLTHCLISGIFPVTTPRPESKMGNKQENNGLITAKVKMAGNELFFVYLLHLAILVLGMVDFTVLSTDPEYAEKMMKLEEVSTISMEVMVYAACPAAFLLGVLSQLVFRQYFDPWKLVRSRIEPGCCPCSCKDCNPNLSAELSREQFRAQTVAVNFRWRKSDRFKRRKSEKFQQRKFREQEQWLQSFECIKDKRNNSQMHAMYDYVLI